MTAELCNRRVLVVEDEYVIAEDMRRSLTKAGAVVLGPVPSVDQALALLDAEAEVDAAVLDVNLGGEKVFPVADALIARGIRFVLATGYAANDLPAAYSHIQRLEKPVDVRALARALGLTDDYL